MKVWYDAEFLENGKAIELISIGIVREDGKEYYAVCADLPWRRINNHPWLMQNVVKHLPGKYIPSDSPANVSGLDEMWIVDRNHPEVKPIEQIRDEIWEFLYEVAETGNEIELWSWYSAYDHVVLCQLWGPMIRRPDFIPMYTNDIRQEFQRYGNPAVPGHLTQDDMPDAHNALADAKYHKRLHEFIVQIGKERYREAVLEALHPELGYWCDLDNLHQEKN